MSVNTHSSGFFAVMVNTVRKDIRISFRYRANFIAGLVEVTLLVVSFFVLSLALDFRTDLFFDGDSPPNALFLFFLSGIMVMIFQSSALFTPLNRINRDLYNGTLEYIYSTPASRYAYYVGGIVSDLLVRQIFFLPMLGLLLLLTSVNPMLLLTLVTFFIMVTSLGIVLSMVALHFKQVQNIVGIFQILFQFLGGAFIPVQTMPGFLRWISYLLPFSYAYDLVRYYSFNSSWIPILPVVTEWGLLVLSSVLFLVTSIFVLKFSENRVRRSGLNLL